MVKRCQPTIREPVSVVCFLWVSATLCSALHIILRKERPDLACGSGRASWTSWSRSWALGTRETFIDRDECQAREKGLAEGWRFGRCTCSWGQGCVWRGWGPFQVKQERAVEKLGMGVELGVTRSSVFLGPML